MRRAARDARYWNIVCCAGRSSARTRSSSRASCTACAATIATRRRYAPLASMHVSLPFPFSPWPEHTRKRLTQSLSYRLNALFCILYVRGYMFCTVHCTVQEIITLYSTVHSRYKNSQWTIRMVFCSYSE